MISAGADLAVVINAAGTRDQVTFVTSRGRRVAAVASVTVAEQAAGDTKAHDDAATATMYAVTSRSTKTGAAPRA